MMAMKLNEGLLIHEILENIPPKDSKFLFLYYNYCFRYIAFLQSIFIFVYKILFYFI